MNGTTVKATVVRVVDGDTLRIKVGEREESLRILALDTEESNAGSSKPVTPWGKKAKEEAQKLFKVGDSVTIEFPGNDPLEACWDKYRDNFGRPLVYVFLSDGKDFQEYMIKNGYSPYFVKYGFADFPNYHQRYTAAEREAQAKNIGVWDQLTVNGAESRNYAVLGTWWYLRGELINNYRQFKQAHPTSKILNTRLDYEKLVQLANNNEQATIFTELRDFRRVGGDNLLIGIGAVDKPFNIFIPDIDEPDGQAIMSLLINRYLPGDSDNYPRRSYAYLTGKMNLFRGNPQIIITKPDQIQDEPSSR